MINHPQDAKHAGKRMVFYQLVEIQTLVADGKARWFMIRCESNLSFELSSIDCPGSGGSRFSVISLDGHSFLIERVREATTVGAV